MKRNGNRILRMLSLMLLISLVMLVAVGCGEEGKVKENLRGRWYYVVYSIDGPCYQIYEFDSDGTYESSWENINAPYKNSYSEGTYEIKDGKITLTEDDGSVESIIEYTLDDDNLELVDKHSDGSGSRELSKDR